MKRSHVINATLTAVVCVVLIGVFGWIYFDDHAWGAWGDDSPGYLFLAGQMLRGETNVYTDELAGRGEDFFGDEKLARWLTPTHHQFINTRGVLASKYPIGLSLVMAAAARLWQNDETIYFVEPALAAVNVALVYLLGLLLFRAYRYRHVVSVVAAAALGLSNLYYDYAIAQPMREIPSMTFLLIAVIALIGAVQGFNARMKHPQQSLRRRVQLWQLLFRKRWIPLLYTAVSGAAFGMAFNIRETILALLPIVALYAVWSLWGKELAMENIKNEGGSRQTNVMHWATNIKRLWFPTSLFVVALAFASIPTIQNSISISKEKEVFKARDTSSVVVLSNIGHVQTLSPENIFNNEGKFRPGKGALPHYWDILQLAVGIHYFMLLALIGVYYYWRESRQQTVLLVGWALSVLVLFSLWINPYSRYILPLFPALMLLGAYGGARLIDTILPTIFPSHKTSRWPSRMLSRALGVVVILTAIVAYQPVIAEVATNLTTDVYRFKAISRDDLHALKDLASSIHNNSSQQKANQPNQQQGEAGQQQTQTPVLMFSGAWQYGISETLETHTGLKTVRFPLEQRFVFDRDQVQQFFDEVLTQEYDVYVWADTTSSADFYTWLGQYNTELVQQHAYTFEPDSRVYRIISKK